MENSLLKTLIVVTLAYYLIKGLIYLLLWQTTYKLQEKALERKRKKQEERLKRIEERKKNKQKQPGDDV